MASSLMLRLSLGRCIGMKEWKVALGVRVLTRLVAYPTKHQVFQDLKHIQIMTKVLLN